MKNNMKIIITIIGVIMVCLTVLALGLGVGWCITNLFTFPPQPKNPDVQKCRDLGGYPIQSNWDGTLLECKKFEVK